MYTVYKVINLINKKYYIGVHKTNNPNDSYYGSGKAIKNAIKKHGKENFKKEVLLITENREDAYEKEKELTENYNSNETYNMKLGGVGGFSKENSMLGCVASLKYLTIEQRSLNGKKGYLAGLGKEDPKINGAKGGKANRGRPKSEAHKQALRDTWKRKLEMANGEPHSS